MSRRVLVLAYYFPPLASVGAVRVGGLARHLPRHGWEAVVVTPRAEGARPEGVEVVETGDADLAASVKRALGLRPDAAMRDLASGTGAAPPASSRRARLVDWGKALLAVPDPHRGWIRLASEAGAARAVRGGIDAVLSSSPPASAHVAGARLAGRTGLPWVADFRDLWSDDRNSTAPAWRRRLDRRLEIRTLRGASAATTVSAPLAAELRALHPRLPVHAILNGFDPGETGPERPDPAQFTLTHTGTFYQGRRDPTLLFETVAGLLAAGRLDRARLRIRLFARHEPWVAALAARCGIRDVVEVQPWASRSEALAAQRSAQVLLLLHWGGAREEGVYTGKVFEYLAARRPILVVGGGPGVLSDLVRDTGAGIHVADRASLEAALLSLWEEYLRSGTVAWRGTEEAIGRYSHVRMAEEFAAVLDGVRDSRIRS